MKAGMVKMAAATSASPTDAAVRTMFCSKTVPRKYGSRKSAMAITAAGMVAAMVCPAFIPRYALAAPKISESTRPTSTAFNVISGGAFSGGGAIDKYVRTAPRLMRDGPAFLIRCRNGERADLPDRGLFDEPVLVEDRIHQVVRFRHHQRRLGRFLPVGLALAAAAQLFRGYILSEIERDLDWYRQQMQFRVLLQAMLDGFHRRARSHLDCAR